MSDAPRAAPAADDPFAPAALRAALEPLFPAVFPPHGRGLVACRPNEYGSSSRGAVVTLGAADGTTADWLVKLERDRADPPPCSRHGIGYEARVYAALVAAAPFPAPHLAGTVELGTPPRRALVIEHLPGCLRVGEAPDDSGIVAAAAWCGRFHAWSAPRAAAPELAFLARIDGATLRAWSRRAPAVAAAVGAVPGWLGRLVALHDERVDTLLDNDATVVHGEFSVGNVLWRDGTIVPVDWESAAVGPGALDLAALVAGWPAEVVARCRAAYAAARGSDDVDTRAWEAAVLHTAFRWLPAADGPGGERLPAALEALRAAADALELG